MPGPMGTGVLELVLSFHNLRMSENATLKCDNHFCMTHAVIGLTGRGRRAEGENSRVGLQATRTR